MRTRHVLILVLMAVLAMLLVVSCGGGGGGGGGTGGGSPYKKLTASDGAGGDDFGISVSASSDGNTVVVGAYLHDVGANLHQGSAYVYKWNGSSWVETKLTASDGAAWDRFGESVSASSDGSTVVVAAKYALTKGAVYVYKLNSSNWVETKITASDGSAYDRFGSSVSVSSDGSTLIVGANQDTVGANANQGSVYVYTWNGSNWVETKLTASDGAASNYFGNSTSISSDGSTVVVGAFLGNAGKGAAYVYKWNGSSWVETRLTASDGAYLDYFGFSVSASSDGSTVVVGSTYDDIGTSDLQGSAYVYKWNGSTWTETKLTASDGALWDYYGGSVSVSSNGNTVLVGSDCEDQGFTKGFAYVYTWNGSSWVEKKLSAADGMATEPGGSSDAFGHAVSMSSDGSVMAISAVHDDIGANVSQGSVYVYK